MAACLDLGQVVLHLEMLLGRSSQAGYLLTGWGFLGKLIRLYRGYFGGSALSKLLFVCKKIISNSFVHLFGINDLNHHHGVGSFAHKVFEVDIGCKIQVVAVGRAHILGLFLFH